MCQLHNTSAIFLYLLLEIYSHRSLEVLFNDYSFCSTTYHLEQTKNTFLHTSFIRRETCRHKRLHSLLNYFYYGYTTTPFTSLLPLLNSPMWYRFQKYFWLHIKILWLNFFILYFLYPYQNTQMNWLLSSNKTSNCISDIQIWLQLFLWESSPKQR